MKISRLVFVVVCFGNMVLLQGCGQGECEEHVPADTKYTISGINKSRIPFSGTDTLVYISNDGDTAILYGQGKKVLFEEFAQNRGGDPGCPRIDYNYFEHIEYVFKSDHPVLKELVFSAFVDKEKEEKALMSLNTIYMNNGYRIGFISYEPRYTDSIEINGTTFFGFTIYSGATKFLYNWRYGFLSLYINNETWKLLK